jgi:hypothetical protein
MEKYLTPQSQALMNMYQILCKWLKENPNEWISTIDDTITNNNVRAIQTFFENPKEALSGEFKIQPLREYDVKSMYSQYEHLTKNLDKDSYYYFFTCNNGLGNGQCFMAHSLIHFGKN